MRELREAQPGGALIARHLIHLMLILALRLHLANGSRARAGWLFALADEQLAAAINAMHSRPERRWTLQSLADHAGTSRSTFALSFKEIVGEPPMEYLIRWRLMLAGDKLIKTSDSIAVIADSLGYESDSAFSAAFRRIMGSAPRQFAKSQLKEPASPGLNR